MRDRLILALGFARGLFGMNRRVIEIVIFMRISLVSPFNALVKIAGLLAELIAGLVLARNTSTATAIILTVVVFLVGVLEGGCSLMRIMACIDLLFID